MVEKWDWRKYERGEYDHLVFVVGDEIVGRARNGAKQNSADVMKMFKEFFSKDISNG